MQCQGRIMKSATRKQTKGTPMNQPLESLEDLVLASLNPRAITGLPHPLSKFAANGAVKEGPYADAIIEFIKDWTCEAPESARHRAAMRCLFQSQPALCVARAAAGLDARMLSSHIRP